MPKWIKVLRTTTRDGRQPVRQKSSSNALHGVPHRKLLRPTIGTLTLQIPAGIMGNVGNARASRSEKHERNPVPSPDDRIFRRQPSVAWLRVGIHSRGGERTLEQLLRKAVEHLEHHLEFVRSRRQMLEGAADARLDTA